MPIKTLDHELVIIGAGAAGIGASIKATEKGVDHIVLEASHRLGGRGLTENLENGVAVDLGCHWMHCASKNPFVQLADLHKFEYACNSNNYTAYANGQWQHSGFMEKLFDARARIGQAMVEHSSADSSKSIWEWMDQSDHTSSWLSYWYSLMHSNDPDQVSFLDQILFQDTDEDWPLRQGYGALVARVGLNAPVSVNTSVTKIEWGKNGVVLHTPRGNISTDKVLITVSTGILNAGDIQFAPSLPDWKQASFLNLPLGNYNNLFFPLRADALIDCKEVIGYQKDDTCALVMPRPFGEPYVFTVIAGRFAWWLESQGERASKNWFLSILMDIFGSNIKNQVGRFKTSAWGYDPWIRGAYSSMVPGVTDARSQLSQSLDDKLFFAGEATSTSQFNTAHGAWQSGQSAIDSMFN